MANDINAVKVGIISAFEDNLDAETWQNVINRYSSAYKDDWNRWLNEPDENREDDDEHRAQFFAEKVFNHTNAVYMAEEYREQAAQHQPKGLI